MTDLFEIAVDENFHKRRVVWTSKKFVKIGSSVI